MITRDPAEPAWRVWWRRGFAAFLAVALVVGLYLSFRPSGFDDQDLAADATPSAPAARSEPPAPPPSEVRPTAPPDGEEQLTRAQINALIAAARQPQETTVQVLDAGGGSDATNDAADVLRELGYDVVAINSSRTDFDTTTVLFTEGNDAEAEALSARDDRFAETAPNERLSDDVDLHVVVGPDW